MMTSYELIDTVQELKKLYLIQKEELGLRLPAALTQIQQDAFNAFNQLGIPTTKAENYRYTDLKPSFSKIYKTALSSQEIQIEEDALFNCDVPNLDTQVEFILNGRYVARQLDLTVLPSGVVYGSLLNAWSEFPELVGKYFAKAADYKDDGLVALNTALALDGFFLFVPKNRQIKDTIQLITMLDHTDNLAVNTRNLIILEDNASAHILVCDHTFGESHFLSNSITEIFAGENASFHLTKMQNANNHSTCLDGNFIYQQANSQVIANAISLHGGLIRNHFHVKLDGEGANNITSGLYLTDRNQQITNHTLIEHLKPHCMSSQLFKGVLDDEAIGAFNGKIHVHPDAQKTEAYQVNRTILLSDTAKMNTKPMLEIYADDVKCSHGATIGQLDDEALFYLQSRGISKKEARLMLMYAFMDEVVSTIQIPGLKERVEELVSKRLRGELSRCNHCDFKCH
ncbi:MAG: Fe-S cluster assembly protein SufD [Bacteroidales bacterium]|nr:Fe-S cluster assembly protein SufD [Bacteroidales bacterium]